METIVFTGNTNKLKKVLTGGILLDVYNDENKDLIVLVLKDDIIFKAQCVGHSLVNAKIRLINQLIYPIKNIFIENKLGKDVLVFVINGQEYDFAITRKRNNETFYRDENCELETDRITKNNYKNSFLGFYLSNHKALEKQLLNKGIYIDPLGLHSVIKTETGELRLIKGTCIDDNSEVTLIYEKVIS